MHFTKSKYEIKEYRFFSLFPENFYTVSQPRIASKSRDRLGIVAYLPGDVTQAYQFLVMLYGAWKFIVDNQSGFFPDRRKFNEINDVDLLVFCHPDICIVITPMCTRIAHIREITTVNSVSQCYAIEQRAEADIPYSPLNSFIMFNRTDIRELMPRYKYLLRTDNDVFITPAIFELKPRHFQYGHGGYSEEFNMALLKVVAKQQNLTHRGQHSIGSTWCGSTSFFIEAGKLTLETTRYIFLNEFDPKQKHLQTIDFKKNKEGEWPRWWRPVSLLYGGELALNHLITNFTSKNKAEFDSSSCDVNKTVWKTPHIHCWHDNCEFQKMHFVEYLNNAINGDEPLPGKIVHRLISNTYPRELFVVSAMNLKEYSTYIAWSSISKYLKSLFVNIQ